MFSWLVVFNVPSTARSFEHVQSVTLACGFPPIFRLMTDGIAESHTSPWHYNINIVGVIARHHRVTNVSYTGVSYTAKLQRFVYKLCNVFVHIESLYSICALNIVRIVLCTKRRAPSVTSSKSCSLRSATLECQVVRTKCE